MTALVIVRGGRGTGALPQQGSGRVSGQKAAEMLFQMPNSQGFKCIAHVPSSRLLEIASGVTSCSCEARPSSRPRTPPCAEGRPTGREGAPRGHMATHRAVGLRNPSQLPARLSSSPLRICGLQVTQRSSTQSLHRCRPSRLPLQVSRSSRQSTLRGGLHNAETLCSRLQSFEECQWSAPVCSYLGLMLHPSPSQICCCLASHRCCSRSHGAMLVRAHALKNPQQSKCLETPFLTVTGEVPEGAVGKGMFKSSPQTHAHEAPKHCEWNEADACVTFSAGICTGSRLV